MHTFDPFNAPKAHAIDVHFQTLSFHLIAVAFGCFIVINELAMTSDANVMSVYLALCHSSEYELTGTQDIALKLTSIHTSIIQRRRTHESQAVI